MRATPWSPDGSDNTFDIQVGMERPAEMVPRDPGEVLMENRGSEDLPSQEQTSSAGVSATIVPECRYLRTGQGRQHAHSEAHSRSILEEDRSPVVTRLVNGIRPTGRG